FKKPLHLTRFLLGSSGCVRALVTANGAREESICRRSDTGKSGEFQLQVDAGVLFPGAAADELAADQLHPPAAGLVFDAGKLLQRLFVAPGVDVAGEAVPVLRDGPGRGDLVLVQAV